MLVGTITVVASDAPGGATADVTGSLARSLAVVGSTTESSAHALANTQASAAPSMSGAREARRRRDIVIPRGKGCILGAAENAAPSGRCNIRARSFAATRGPEDRGVTLCHSH